MFMICCGVTCCCNKFWLTMPLWTASWSNTWKSCCCCCCIICCCWLKGPLTGWLRPPGCWPISRFCCCPTLLNLWPDGRNPGVFIMLPGLPVMGRPPGRELFRSMLALVRSLPAVSSCLGSVKELSPMPRLPMVRVIWSRSGAGLFWSIMSVSWRKSAVGKQKNSANKEFLMLT